MNQVVQLTWHTSYLFWVEDWYGDYPRTQIVGPFMGQSEVDAFIARFCEVGIDKTFVINTGSCDITPEQYAADWEKEYGDVEEEEDR